MRTYNIILSNVFPFWHLHKGEPTKFKEMLRIIKLHTIRANYDLWKKRFEEIDRGEAVLVIREWVGRPYRSKTSEITRLTKDSGIGLQQLTFGKGLYGLTSLCRPIVDGKEVRTELLAHNDGLSLEEWINCFPTMTCLSLWLLYSSQVIAIRSYPNQKYKTTIKKLYN